MAWEKRWKRAYYYRSIRRADGGVSREYLGSGTKAQQIAQAQLARQADQAAAVALFAETEPLLALANELETGADLLLEAVLRVNGYGEHRGCWRRKRGAKT